MASSLIEVEDLSRHFSIYKGLLFQSEIGRVRAVDGISFAIRSGETLGIVGESGCGKTTTSRLLLGLDEPTSGTIRLEGEAVATISGEMLKTFRSKVQAVFQDPWSSLNPRMRVRDIIAEPLVVTRNHSREALDARVLEMLNLVGLNPAMASRYPHEFSGGQRQRIAIAAALAPSPRLVVLDEPVSALDVSVRAQVMNLLKEIQDEQGVAYMLIAHNLATVRFMAHQTAVMYLGRIVEIGPTEEVFGRRLHPYTQALFSASLSAHPNDAHTEVVLQGETPSPLNPPSGCRFHTRCRHAVDKCKVIDPELQEVSQGYRVACHLVEGGVFSGGANSSSELPVWGL